jgi:hypothetical protein
MTPRSSARFLVAAAAAVSQIAVMLALAGIAFGDPAQWLGYTVAFSLALGLAGATQDVTIDGWRITAVPVRKQSVMTAISEWDTGLGRSLPAQARFFSPTDMAGALPIFAWRRS